MRRGYFGIVTVIAAMVLLCVMAESSTASPGATTRISAGNSADISADGRYVTFVSSDASNLVEGDTNGFADIFVHDRTTHATQRVSVSSSGLQANAHSSQASISADGRYVAFESDASNLVEGDTNDTYDIFVRDRDADADGVFDEVEVGAVSTERVSESSDGTQANGESRYDTDISSNGRVAFTSDASNLVKGDTNGGYDFFVRDLHTHKTERVNVDQAGNQVEGGGTIAISISSNGRYVGFSTHAAFMDPYDPGDHTDAFVRDLDPEEGQTKTIWRVGYDAYGAPSISDDGLVAFTSYATNLVPGDTNSVRDVFVRDLEGQSTQRVSVSSSGTQANAHSHHRISISPDGRFVSFTSSASNLVAKDTNGFDDVFVRDLQARTTEQVSVAHCAPNANGRSDFETSISRDGGYVAFTSLASNLVPYDSNNRTDVFVRDRQAEPDTLPSECIAPTTTARATFNSGIPYESGTWTKEDVTVSLSAQDNEGGSGIKEISYSINGGAQQTYDPMNRIPVNIEGTTTIRYLATDKEGNVESPAKTFAVKIDKSPPTVDNVYPADAATDVDTWGYANASFSEAMDPDTLTPSTFTLTKQGSSTPVEAKVTYETYEATEHYAWVETSSELASNTTYTATIKGGASGAKDLVGNALQQDYSWTFTTGGDTTPPETFIDSGPSGTVSSTSDSFTFSSDESDATFECKLDNDTFKSCTSPKRVPDDGLLIEGKHTFEVRATDSDGNTDTTHASRTWTVDTTAPTISTVTPANQSQNVALGTNVEATFSETMNASTLTTSALTLTKQNSSIPVAATVSYSSTNKATLDPSSDLASNTTYTATVKGGSTGAKDSAGNALAQDHSWSFTTGPPPDTTAPKVSTATPTGTGVARGTNAIATFSEKMDPTTITASTFKLFKCSSTTSTNCATQITNVGVSLSTDRLKATLNPYEMASTLLAGRTKYKVVVTTGAKDEAGNPLDQDPSTVGNQNKVWYFTTGGS